MFSRLGRRQQSILISGLFGVLLLGGLLVTTSASNEPATVLGTQIVNTSTTDKPTTTTTTKTTLADGSPTTPTTPAPTPVSLVSSNSTSVILDSKQQMTITSSSELDRTPAKVGMTVSVKQGKGATAVIIVTIRNNDSRTLRINEGRVSISISGASSAVNIPGSRVERVAPGAKATSSAEYVLPGGGNYTFKSAANGSLS